MGDVMKMENTMPNVVTIKLRVNVTPALVGVKVAGLFVSAGLPRVGYLVAKGLMWIRVSHATSKPWHGWTWIGKDFHFSHG